MARVRDGIPRVLGRGSKVRCATTVEDQTGDELARLWDLHRGLGISDEDHGVRSVVRRGRAATAGMGVELGPSDVLPELTLTADGAFLYQSAPTVMRGRTALGLLVSRPITPRDATHDTCHATPVALSEGPGHVTNHG